MTDQDRDRDDETKPETPAALEEAAEVPPEPEVEPVEPSSEANEPESSAPEPSKKSMPWLSLCLLVLLVGLAGTVGYGAYWLWPQWQAAQQNQQAVVAAQAALANELKQVTELSARVEQSVQQQQAKVDASLTQLENLVVASAQRLSRQANLDQDKWALEEALTLARLSAQRLQLDADASVAVRLLKAADERLASLDQAAVLPLRRQLAKDILALQQTDAVDINGAYFQLAAIADAVKAAKNRPQPSLIQPVPEGEAPAAGFWHQLKQVIVVQRLDVPRTPMPLQSDFEQWRQQTLLLLQQTQLALLARNQALFDAALAQSEASLVLMQSQLKVQPWLAALVELRTATLNPQWPDINASVTALEDYLAQSSTPVTEEGE